MLQYFVEPDWLEACRGGSLYYPSALHDHRDLLSLFIGYLDKFCFCDINYRRGLEMVPALQAQDEFRLMQTSISGSPWATIESRCTDGRTRYRFLEPSWREEIYSAHTARTISIVRRRGFGQFGLIKDFADRSLSVFVHRGDSPGEGGSNVYYLANRGASYEPLGNLFEKLSRKLKNRAIVISDGSNTTIPELSRFQRIGIDGDEAFSRNKNCSFRFGGFLWVCIGYLSNRNGPTLAWGLERQPE